MDAAEWTQVDQLVVECSRVLFSAFGVEAQHTEGLDEGKLLKDLTLAVMGFAGPHMRGSLLLSAEGPVLIRSHPVKASGRPPTYEEIRDWSGELVNQLLGRIKNKLLRRGVAMQLSTPTTLSGLELRVGPSARNSFCLPHRFETANGSFQVRFEAVAEASSHLAPPEEVHAEVGAEGDALLF